jgi:hypothetical protein
LATGFLASLAGTALEHAAHIYDSNVDALSATPAGMSFKDFIRAYIAEFGTDQDRQYQLEAIPYVRKPRGCSVTRWKTIFRSLNDAVEYCRGTGEKLDGANFKNAYFKSFCKLWQDAFLSNGSQNLHTATVDQITSFMTQREAAAYFQKVSKDTQVSRKRPGDNGLEDKDDESVSGDIIPAKKTKRNGRDKRHANGNSNGSGNGNGGGKNTKNTRFSLTNGKCLKCPDTVPSHLWAKCPYNRNNPDNILACLETDVKKDEAHYNSHQYTILTDDSPEQLREYDKNFKCLKPCD